MITYTLIRSRRKTLAIYITKDARIEVRAPLQTSKIEIDRFVSAKEKWIIGRLSLCEKRLIERSTFSLNYGDSITLLGKTYPICAKGGKTSGYDGECFYLPPDLLPDDIKRTVVHIYKKVAKQVIGIKVDKYAKLMSVTPASIKITRAKTRWGSCSGKNSLSFSWRLIMAEEGVVDYVVVHELAHIKEHNHSQHFWAVVEKIMPDYKHRRLKLKSLQDKLSRENWD